MQATTPVTRLLVMQISSGMSCWRRCRINSGSRAAAIPWPIRSAPRANAAHIDSGPMLSPACAVSRKPAAFANVGIGFGETLSRAALFTAADAECHHASIHALGRQLGHAAARASHAELPHRVQNPLHLHGGFTRGLAHGVEDGTKLLAFPQHHARGNDDFGVADVLLFQALKQPPRDQRIIFGMPQPLANGAERLQERVEIGVTVERAKLFQAGCRVELMQRFGLDGALQVQVQLSLRQFG